MDEQIINDHLRRLQAPIGVIADPQVLDGN